MERIIFQIPGYIEKIETISAGQALRLRIDTQENINSDAMAKLFNLKNKLGWFTFNVNQIEADDLINLPPIKNVDEKSKSQRLRAVLYRLWQQNDQGFKTNEEHYNFMMEKIIEHYKSQLEK